MTDRQFEILKIIVDNGIVALIIALFAYFLARSLERLRSSLAERAAWNSELLKQRLEVARHTIVPVTELAKVHEKFVRIRSIGLGGGDLVQELLRLANNLELPMTELAVYGAGTEVVDHLERIKATVNDSVFKGPVGDINEFDPNDVGGSIQRFNKANPDLQKTLKDWADARAKLMKELVSTLRTQLASSLNPS